MKSGRIVLLLVALCIQTSFGAPARGQAPPLPVDSSLPPTMLPQDALPLIDAHNHVVPGRSAETIVSFMDRAGIRKIVLMTNRIPPSRPLGWEDAFVLEAYGRYPDRIIPFLTTVRAGQGSLSESAFIEYAEAQLKTGKFKGMGEFMVEHYSVAGAGRAEAPHIRVPADRPLMQAMMRLGARYNVPLTIHMETTPDTLAALERSLQANPKTKLIWAHQNPVKMGGGPEERLARRGDPDQIARLFDKYPNLFADTALGYESMFVRPQDRSLPENWKGLYEKYNDRFVIGFDLADGNMWEKNALPRVNFIRAWLSQLSPDTARKLAYENIERILTAKP